MKTRDVYLARDETIPDSGLKYIRLDVSHPISALVVEIEATTGQNSCVDHAIHDDIRSIEVIDGSNVLYSLNGRQCIGLYALLNKRFPPQTITQEGGAIQKETFIIQFGRYLFDPEYALDPRRFTNPQLAISYALTINSDNGFATGTGKLTVVARCMEEGYGPLKGWLMTKAHYPFNATANQNYAIDLPRDYPYRLIAFQALAAGKGIADNLDRLELSIDNDAWVPYRLYADELKYFQQEWFGTVNQKMTVLKADNGVVSTDIYEINEAVVQLVPDLHVATVEGIAGNRLTLGLLVLSTTPSIAKQTTAKVLNVSVDGYCPCGLIGLPFGGLNDVSSWLQAQKTDSIKLKFQAKYGFAGDVIIQQLRS